jgi:hypothetical protein
MSRSKRLAVSAALVAALSQSAGPGAPGLVQTGAQAATPTARHVPVSLVSAHRWLKEYARSLMERRYGWGSYSQFVCLVDLWDRESGWNKYAFNPGSGAYGIPQSLPGTKMASAGANWRTSGMTQISWGLGYVRGRYGWPCAAWRHEESDGWYAYPV